MEGLQPPRGRRWVLALAFLLAGARAAVYQSHEDFLAAAFAGDPPPPALFWLRGEVKAEVERILGHPYAGLRIRYWRRGPRTAWILEEIGKERPITAGIVIRDGAVERVRVLAFRESRGGEVRHGFFLDQFPGTRLRGDGRLDRQIDGITGATLSVRALKRLVRLALHLDGRVREDG